MAVGLVRGGPATVLGPPSAVPFIAVTSGGGRSGIIGGEGHAGHGLWKCGGTALTAVTSHPSPQT